MKIALALIGAASALSIALPAVAASQPGENICFWTRDLRNHTVDGDKNIYFNVNGRDVYRVETDRTCLAGVTSSDPIVMVNRTGSGQICTKMDLDIRIRGNHCIVASMTKLSKAEAAAIPRKIQP
jgi:hypothetical protein